MIVRLRLKEKLKVPVDAESISPDVFAGKSVEEIAELPLWKGNRKVPLKNIFEIEGPSGKVTNEVVIHIDGNLSKVQRIGSGMTDGEIVIAGDIGMHLGIEMEGGKITVEGNAGSWLGSSMKGGTIEVNKNAGDYIGAPYRGSTNGMRGGTITIHGNAGTEAGRYMKKGLIRIDGDVDQFVGIHLKKGAILVGGNADGRAGAFMTGGKIIICGHLKSLLPTFTIDSTKGKAKAEEEIIKEPFYLFIGDLAEHGSGKLYLAKRKNKHLEAHEKLLQ